MNADLPRRDDGVRPAYADALDKDIAESNARLDDIFGGALEARKPFVIKRTRRSKQDGVILEFFVAVPTTYHTKPVWGRSIDHCVGFDSREDALQLIHRYDLRPRAEVVQRAPVQNIGR